MISISQRSSENLRFSDGFRGSKSWLIRLILLNIRSEIRRPPLSPKNISFKGEKARHLNPWILLKFFDTEVMSRGREHPLLKAAIYPDLWAWKVKGNEGYGENSSQSFPWPLGYLYGKKNPLQESLPYFRIPFQLILILVNVHFM